MAANSVNGTLPERRSYTCPECPLLSYTSLRHLNDHLKSVHPTSSLVGRAGEVNSEVVLCSCGFLCKGVNGVSRHRGSMSRVGNPCPPMDDNVPSAVSTPLVASAGFGGSARGRVIGSHLKTGG